MGFAQRMGFAESNTFPEEAVYAPALSGEGTTPEPFDGIKAIQIHLYHSARLKDYLCARSRILSDVPMSCHSECTVARWLHSENGKEFANCKLLDSVCRRCEEFHELAAESVLRTKMGIPEPVLEVVQSVWKIDRASNAFQTALAELHVECWYNQ